MTIPPGLAMQIRADIERLTPKIHALILDDANHTPQGVAMALVRYAAQVIHATGDRRAYDDLTIAAWESIA